MGLLCQMLAHTISQCEVKMGIRRFFTGEEVEDEAVARASSHNEQGKQGVLMYFALHCNQLNC